MYKIILSRLAEKDLNKINKIDKPHIFSALFDLRKEPFSGKKLKGKLQNCYSLRVSNYRIIYKIYKKEIEILVIRIGERQGIYNE
jgi:mRNA interferase RelE/StbE